MNYCLSSEEFNYFLIVWPHLTGTAVFREHQALCKDWSV